MENQWPPAGFVPVESFPEGTRVGLMSRVSDLSPDLQRQIREGQEASHGETTQYPRPDRISRSSEHPVLRE